MSCPDVKAFFDTDTNTVSYVVSDPETRQCALIDSVLNYDASSGRTHHYSAQQMVDYVRNQELEVSWILETHVHADHLSDAPFLQRELGGRLGIGEHIRTVQKVFGNLFNAEPGFLRDGSQFDHLFKDNECFHIGQIEARAIHTPGHTPACMTYVIGDAAFVGDTLFMPDYGTARCDFPGGDAHSLYDSVQRIFELPDDTRVFLCHDYLPEGRKDFQWQTSVAEQRAHNIHIHSGISAEEFIRMRQARDATLDMPRLILPSVQINMRAGDLPPEESNGIHYLKIPLNVF